MVEWHENNRAELYNPADDRGERNDLAGDKPEKAKELLALLEDWRRSVSAQMPTPNSDYQEGPATQNRGPKPTRTVGADP